MISEIFPSGCYFIGIGGVSMSALALFLHDRGVCVRGSDVSESNFTEMLQEKGIPVTIGNDEEIYEGTVVYTGAVDASDRQLSVARRAGKRLISRAELLGRLADSFPHVVSVAGCHGKTSTTSMLAHIFEAGKHPYTVHIGGEDAGFGNYRNRGEEFFLTEACEFKRSFLSLKSEIALILNTDRDHTDCYHDEEETLRAYALFAAQAKKTVVNGDERNGRKIPHVLSFGRYSGDIGAGKVFSDGEFYRFTVVENSVPMVEVRLNVRGEIHVSNALAAYAAARLCGFTAAEIKLGLESFRGVKRRFEEVGTLAGAPVICDYAHHPREIEMTIATAERICRGRVRIVFQPHTYTRTRDLMGDFVRVLKRAEQPIIYKTYAAREKFDASGSAVALVGNLPEASYVQSPAQLKARLTDGLSSDDLILVLGAGDIYSIIKTVLDE